MHTKNILYPPLGIITFLALLLLMPTCPVIAGEGSPEAQALALQNKYNSLTSLTFIFDQVTRTGARERYGRGEAMFYRYHPPTSLDQENITPAKQSVMRWNYAEPDPQIIISDGETLSIYTEKDKQLIRTPAKELESDITYAFFAGSRNLLDDFVAEQAETDFVFSSGQELKTLLLVPRKPHNQIRDVQVWFDADYLIRHLKVTDHFDSVTELNFNTIMVDSMPPGDRKTLNEIISFPLPPGTEIISR